MEAHSRPQGGARKNIPLFPAGIRMTHDIWKRRNRYYYAYIDELLGFLVPEGKQTVRFSADAPDAAAKGTYDYVLLTDALGSTEDVEELLRRASALAKSDGRVVMLQYSALWEPILRLASKGRLRRPNVEQNWLSRSDLSNLAEIAGL